MKVFVDKHHGDLYYSLHHLFEDRLGDELYFPIGWDWFHQGFWKIARPYGDAPQTIGQYLDINNDGYMPYKNLNGENYLEDGVYRVYDPGHDVYYRAITLEKFKEMKFDIIISSIPEHDDPYYQLITQFQPQAKQIAQIGNTGQTTRVKNVMASMPYVPLEGQNVVNYHQEIDTRIYKEADLPNNNKITSLVNLHPYPDLFSQYRASLPEFEFKAYGSGSPDGPLNGSKAVANEMAQAQLGWQIKDFGGFGHTPMGWFKTGRGVITNLSLQSAHAGTENSLMYEDQVTCINLEARSFEANLENIRYWMLPENTKRMSDKVKERFKQVFNYDREEQSIREFLSKLI